jgi:formylglycine-generating enzyme required for sulfatase activity
MGTNPSYFKGDSLPVEMVSWNDAVKFCKKLNRRQRKTYRLPTEAEWEYACRSGTDTPFHTGETISTEQANYDGNKAYSRRGQKGVYRMKTTEVGSFSPNSFGLYDMHGNVWEWCSDWIGWYVKKYNSNKTSTDPKGPDTGKARVLRGGSWNHHPEFCRSACRYAMQPKARYGVNGFRIVMEMN